MAKEDEERILRGIFSTLVSLQTNTEQILGHIKDELDKLTGQISLYGNMIQSGKPLGHGAEEGQAKERDK